VVAGLFQLADGVQSVAAGALRGLKDTAVPMLFGGLGYWLVGMPLGLLLAFGVGFGPLGIWVGIVPGGSADAGALGAACPDRRLDAAPPPAMTVAATGRKRA
jgi:MATE family multidrug resistance protein